MALRDLLKNKLIDKELNLVPTSFDIIGNKEKAVAIIELPDELKKRQEIANALMKQHKNVRSVLLKKSPRSGVYRTMKLRLIAGDKNTVVTHSESGCRFLLDPRKVYFSPRESAERMRIAEKVKSDETVMVFFAGIGPFAIVIAKKSKLKKVIGIEINPAAVKYFKKNAKLNKIEAEIVKGDVRNAAKRFYGSCDRVIMPLPETSIDYLEEAINCLKCDGIIHYYCFAEEDKINEVKKRIQAKTRKKIEFIETKKVLPYGPRIWKYRIDFVVK
ncbi:MAG: class I SAM-dependent methyltransferase family protein [Candidatus Aenigmatarchaeota archaeon]